MIANTRVRGDAPTPTPLPALAAVATPTAPDRPPERDPAAPQRFAELLRQRRADAAPARSPAPQAAPLSSETHAAEAGVHQSSAAESMGGRKPACNSAIKSQAPNAKDTTGTAAVENTTQTHEPDVNDEVGGVDRESAEAPGHARSGAAEPTSATAAATVDATALAIGIDGRGRRDVADDVGAIANDPGADATRGAMDRAAPNHARGEVAVDANPSMQPLDTSRMQTTAAATDLTFRAASGDAAHRAELRATEQRRDAAIDTLGAAGAIGALARPGEPAAATSAPTVSTLATPIDAPDFAAALGVQVTLLAHDGIQHAELHLNPAETGPVSIRIELDGTAARVDFGADLAATRQAIERGLPELASALRDAGLTLTGGGVSQHAQGGGDDGHEAAERAARRIDAVASPAPTAAAGRITRPVALGGIDLYA